MDESEGVDAIPAEEGDPALEDTGKPMPAKLIALYNKPVDAMAFDKYYYATHVPIAKRIPGLKRYEVSDGPVSGVNGDSAYHVAAILTFDSMSDLRSALGSDQGNATAADLGNFAQAGVDLLMFESKDV